MKDLSRQFFLFIILFILQDLSGFELNNYYYSYGKKSASLNSFGHTGLIQMPSGQTQDEGFFAITINRNGMYKFGSMTIAPFNWLEASYFYYRPYDIWWTGPRNRGKYLDKGFSVKFSKKINRHSIALGLEDFAGTGFFSREFIVATSDYNNLRFTYGLGFGKYVGVSGFSNPFRIIFPDFQSRRIREKGFQEKSEPLYTEWFRGDAIPILGAEIFLPFFKDVTIKIEKDSFDYLNGLSTDGYFKGQDFNKRKKDKSWNFGLDLPLYNNFNVGISLIKGNMINFSFSVKGNFSKPFFKKRLPKDFPKDSNKGNFPKISFYEDLIYNINSKGVYLQSANITNDELKVAISSSKYRNPIHIHRIVGDVAQSLGKLNPIPMETLTTVGINVGHELYQLKTPIKSFDKPNNAITELVIRDSELSAGEGDSYRFYEFRPTINYPASFTRIAPILVNHIGDPAKFYYGGIVLRLDNEMQFSSRLQLNTEIHQNISNNFDEKRNFPDSLLPRVRTDIVSYLQESDTYISRMQLDYFFNPYKEFFGKFSAGILENMYSGAGVEFLYKPFEQNFSVGLEAYRAKKRAFDRRFNLLDYEINTGHLNFNYHLPKWGILGTLSYGRYLAGDEGYTFDISRRLSSGFRTGIFFTRTNVSAEQFGEGSFDKGFYFQIPIDLFLNDYGGGYINFKLRPLTRDGGQKLEAGNELIGIMHSTSRAEIERDWNSFND